MIMVFMRMVVNISGNKCLVRWSIALKHVRNAIIQHSVHHLLQITKNGNVKIPRRIQIFLEAKTTCYCLVKQ